jgi:ERCC4-type nuclease
MMLIDDRAGSVELIPLLPPELVSKRRLESGDIAFFGYGPEGPYTLPIGIEYKTTKDALQCMHDGRLTGEQMPGMSDIYSRVYIVIEGQIREGPDGVLQFLEWRNRKPVWIAYSKTSYRQFDNWLNSVAEVGRVIIKRSVDRVESAAQILNLYYFWAKDYEQHLSVFKLHKSQEPARLTRPSTKRRMAAAIPGVGDKLSGRVADHFDNVVEMVNAEVDAWQKVNGIGKTKASEIYKSLRESAK